MTLAQKALLYEAMRSVDLSEAIEEVCDKESESALKRACSALDKGSLHEACIARGEKKAWEQVAAALKRAAKSAAPDQS